MEDFAVEIKRCHASLLTAIFDKMVVGSPELNKFLWHMKTYVPASAVAEKNLLEVFSALECSGELRVGHYQVLKDIATDSGNKNLLPLIKKAEDQIKSLKNKDSAQHVSSKKRRKKEDVSVSDKLYAAMAEGHNPEKHTPKGVLTDRNLTDISNNIGNGWESLAACLNVSMITVERIKEDFKLSQQQIYNMLLHWRSTERYDVTMTSLFEKMHKAAGVSIDWKRLHEMFGPIFDNDKLYAAMAEGHNPEKHTSKGVPTDRNLTDISRIIGTGWLTLAVYLNVSHLTIEHIMEDHKQSVQQQIYNMLLQWRSNEGCNATMTSLFEKMYKAAGVSIDWKRLREMFGPMVDNARLSIEKDNSDEPVVPSIKPSLAAMTISQAVKLPLNTIVTIQGHVIEVKDMVQLHVRSRGLMTVTDMYIMDGSSHYRVSLWEDAMNLQVRSGDVVIITDVCVATFQNVKYCKSTGSTNMEIVTQGTRSPGAENRRPSEDPLTSLKHALESQVDTLVNVKGQVVKVEAVRHVTIDGTSKPIKDLYLKDSSLSVCRVSLWEDLSKIPMVTGETFKLSNLAVKKYGKEKYLTSTRNTIVEENEITSSVNIEQRFHHMLIGVQADRKNEPKGESQCKIYSKKIEYKLKHYCKKNRSVFEIKNIEVDDGSRDRQTPVCLKKKKYCNVHMELLSKLATLAYNTLFTKNEESSLVFDRRIAKKYLTDKEIEMSVAVEILTQEKVIGKRSIRKSQISFFNKTFQEYFATLYVAMNPGMVTDVEETIKHVCSTEKILEIKQFFIFLNELCPAVMLNLADSVSEDSKTERYRGVFSELDVSLYQKALLEGKEKDTSVRVMVVGCHGQGKTSLIKRLLKQHFDKDEPSTNGIDLSVTNAYISKDGALEIASPDLNDKVKRLAFVVNAFQNYSTDQAVHNDVNTVTQCATDGRNMLHASEEKRMSQENDESRMSPATDERRMSSSSDDFELQNNNVPEVAQPAHTDLYNCVNSELKNNITGHDGKKILFWDFGGQFIYYSTHQLFHSRDAIYLLVFDLSKPLNEEIPDGDTKISRTMAYYLKFWANSIHSFVGTDDGAPPIILVGTHRDDCTNPDNYFVQVRTLFDGQNSTLYNHFKCRDFAVENFVESDEHVNQLFKYIDKLADKEREVPAKWIQMDVELEKLKDKKIVPFTTIQEVNSMMLCPIEDVEQLKLYLRYRHSQGIIIYFDETTLCEYVVLEPQYLIDAFKCLITTESNRMMPNVIKWWRELYNNAKLYKNLLEEIWIDFKEYFELLLMFLEKYRLIAKVPSLSKIHCISAGAATGVIRENSEYFIVPCFLKPDDNKTIEAFYNRKEATKTSVSIVYRFESTTITPTIHQQITAAAIGKWPVIEHCDHLLLFDTVGVYLLPHEEENHVGIIRAIETDIYLTVITCCEGTIDPMSCHDFQQFVEDIIQHVFRKFQSEMRCKKCIRCTCNYVDQTKEKLRGLDDLLASGDKFPCEHLKPINKKNAYEQWFPKDIHNPQEEVEPLNSLLQAPCTEKDLVFIAGCLGCDVLMLAYCLEIDTVVVDHIKRDFIGTVDHITQTLKKWQMKNYEQATLASLFQIIAKLINDIPSVKCNWVKLEKKYGPIPQK